MKHLEKMTISCDVKIIKREMTLFEVTSIKTVNDKLLSEAVSTIPPT